MLGDRSEENALDQALVIPDGGKKIDGDHLASVEERDTTSISRESPRSVARKTTK